MHMSFAVITMAKLPLYRVNAYVSNAWKSKRPITMIPAGSKVNVIRRISHDDALAYVDEMLSKPYIKDDRHESLFLSGLRNILGQLQRSQFNDFQTQVFAQYMVRNKMPGETIRHVFGILSEHPLSLATFLENATPQNGLTATYDTWAQTVPLSKDDYQNLPLKMPELHLGLPQTNQLGFVKQNRYIYVPASFEELHRIDIIKTADAYLLQYSDQPSEWFIVGFRRGDHADYMLNDASIAYLRSVTSLMTRFSEAVSGNIIGAAVCLQNDVTVERTATLNDDEWLFVLNLLRNRPTGEVDGNEKKRLLMMCDMYELNDMDITIKRIANYENTIIPRSDRLRITAKRIRFPEWTIADNIIFLCGVPFMYYVLKTVEKPEQTEAMSYIQYAEPGEKIAVIDGVCRDDETFDTILEAWNGSVTLMNAIFTSTARWSIPKRAFELSESLWAYVMLHACRARLSEHDVRPLQDRIIENYLRLCCPQISAFAPQYKLLQEASCVLAERLWQDMIPSLIHDASIFGASTPRLKLVGGLLVIGNRSTIQPIIEIPEMDPIFFGMVGPWCVLCTPISGQPYAFVGDQTATEARFRVPVTIEQATMTSAHYEERLLVFSKRPTYVQVDKSVEQIVKETSIIRRADWPIVRAMTSQLIFNQQ